MMQNQMYGKVDVFPGDEADVAMDPAGYTGQFFRGLKKQKLEQISESDFVRLLVKQDRMQTIMTMIRYIDKDKNGCVTTSEMDDILREVYP